MKTARRFLGLLLALALLLTAAPLPVRAAAIIGSGSIGADITWALDSDGQLTISGRGEMPYCEMEAQIPWYEYRDEIRSVVIEEGITSVGPYAFYDCFYLTSVTLPDSIAKIENRAFYMCRQLRDIAMPAGLTEIGKLAFYMCIDLRRIEFPDRLTKIGGSAFNSCYSLSTVIFPESLETLQMQAFRDCSALQVVQFLGDLPDLAGLPDDHRVTLYYPAGNETWADYSGGSYVTSLPWEPGDPLVPAQPEPDPRDNAPAVPLAPGGAVLDSGSCGAETDWTLYESGLLVISGNGPMEICGDWEQHQQTVTAVIIEEGVTAVADDAFSGFGEVAYIAVAASVSRIGPFAFSCCYSLENVVFAGAEADIGYQALFDISTTCWYPAGSWSHGGRLQYGGQYVTWLPYSGDVQMPDTPPIQEPDQSDPPPVQELLDSGSCGDGVTWTLTADGLLTISGQGPMEDYPEDYPGWDAYAGSLERVVVEEGVTHIGDYAFWGYRRISGVELPDTLESIGGVAFGYCTGLREVTIPANVTEIRDYAFAQCQSLERIDFAGSFPYFGLEVFLDVDAMASHPAGDSSWDGVEAEDFGGMLSWLREGTPDSLELIYAPTVTGYAVGDAVDLRGIWVEAHYADGTTVLLKRSVMTLESADTSAVGVHTAVASYQGLTVEFPIYVHAGRRTEALDPALWPESPHPYGGSMDDVQTVSCDGASSLTLTFSEDTCLEPRYDVLTLLDSEDHVYYEFTAAEAAGRTVTIPGSVVRIRLQSDETYNEYGYSFTAITAEVLEHTGTEQEAVEPTCNTDGHTGGLLCDICGQLTGGQLIPALGHEWGDWAQMDNSTGLYRVCAVCGDYDYLSADRLFTHIGDSEYEELTMAQIREMYDAVDWDMASDFETAPSPRAPYVIGRLTNACLDNLTAQLNFYRRLAKLDSVSWDEELVEYAQAAAVTNAAVGTLTHFPSQPADMDDAIYEKGAYGASHSNLARGTHLGLMDSVPGYLDDSDSSNIDAVGHRRWALNPDMGLVGFGAADADSYSHYHAMYAMDLSNAGYTNADFAAFPGGNRIYPSELFGSHMAWSVQLDSGVFREPNAGEVRVTLTRESDGRIWSFGNQAQDSQAGYFNINSTGYGNGYAVIFRPAGVSSYGGVYSVMITGLRTRSGETAAISYSVDFQSLEQTDVHVHTPELRDAAEPDCENAGYSGDSYCTDCGALITEGAVIEPLGHDYENGVCTRCGQTQMIPGDLNGDGAVTSDDAIHLLYHTLFGDLYPVSGDCDYNHDGAVDSDDAIYLLYYTLFGDALYPLS